MSDASVDKIISLFVNFMIGLNVMAVILIIGGGIWWYRDRKKRRQKLGIE